MGVEFHSKSLQAECIASKIFGGYYFAIGITFVFELKSNNIVKTDINIKK